VKSNAKHEDRTSIKSWESRTFLNFQSVVEGYNGTVFAYGQTGSGKSFTMSGVEKPITQRGIIPRTFEQIYESIATISQTKFLVHVSYLEVSHLFLRNNFPLFSDLQRRNSRPSRRKQAATEIGDQRTRR
jgi:hypothetical protein